MDVFSVEQREQMIHYAQLAAEYGLVPNTQGNISLRDPETDQILITPHDLPYGTMTPDDLVVVNLAGDTVAGTGIPPLKCLCTAPSTVHAPTSPPSCTPSRST